jgi:hypothetical protein
VALATLDMRDKSDATRIVFIPRVVQPLGNRLPKLVCAHSAPIA